MCFNGLRIILSFHKEVTMDFVQLIGAEDVSRASHNMQSAASQMQAAASSIDDSLQRHKVFLDDWLCRLEEIIKENQCPTIK